MFSLPQRSYPEILCDLEALKQHLLTNLGSQWIPVRLSQAIDNIKELEQLRRDNRLEELISPNDATAEPRARELVWSIVEGQQLSTIFAGLRDYEPRRVIKRKMEQALKGPLDPNDETSNTNEGRNILFELLLGAQFRRAGLDAKIGGKADLQLDHARGRLYVECKRPFVEKSIRENILIARTQLRKRFDADERPDGVGGLVAISISKVLNKGSNMFVVENEDELEHKLGAEVMQIHEQYGSDYGRQIDLRLVGMFYHLFTPAYVSSTRRLIIASEILIRTRGDSVQTIFPISGDLLTQHLRSLGGF